MDKPNPPPPPVSHKSDSTVLGGKTGQRVRSTEGGGRGEKIEVKRTEREGSES